MNNWCEDDDFLREPPERIVKCMNCGRHFYEEDGCDCAAYWDHGDAA